MPISRLPHTHTPPPPGPFEFRFTPGVSAIRLSRQVLAGWLELQPGIDKIASEDLIIVCSELVTNAIRHAEGGAAGPSVAVRAAVDDDSVVLEVEDAGQGFPWPNRRGFGDVGLTDEQGRGLLIVDALTDDIGVVTTDVGTVVRCVKHGVIHDRPPRRQQQQPTTTASASTTAPNHAGAGAGGR
jgi:anti-sigma regulatory factor (Ser/Thr protein kinase)